MWFGAESVVWLGVSLEIEVISCSAVIDRVSYVACLNVNDLYTARLRCRGRSSSTRVLCVVTQNAVCCPDFGMVIRRDHAVRARRVGTGLNAHQIAFFQLATHPAIPFSHLISLLFRAV